MHLKPRHLIDTIMSLYDRLGVKKDASTDEIRRAYKDMAKQMHPDRGGDPEEFKRIQEAHEVLSDEERRRMYDITGSTDGNAEHHGGMAAGGFPFHFMGGAGPFGMPGVAFDIGSMFGGIFGGAAAPQKRQRQGKGPNKHHDIGLSLSEFYAGREIKLKFNQARRCEMCGGSGAEKTEVCGPCGGKGVRTITRQIGPQMFAQQTGPCDNCGGDGKRIIKACGKCHSKKFLEREKVLSIQIKPGMRDGETLIFPGECSDSLDHESPGDVVLCLKRADVPSDEFNSWVWRGNDLYIRKRVTFAQSVIGFKIELDGHPSGKRIVVAWRKGPIITGTSLEAKGWGMPVPGTSGHGSCYVEVHVDPLKPKEWTTEQREQLRSLFGGEVETIDSEDVVQLSLNEPAA
jgi:DnaJ-class molecular chaperone